jgi:hypothetical protein
VELRDARRRHVEPVRDVAEGDVLEVVHPEERGFAGRQLRERPGERRRGAPLLEPVEGGLEGLGVREAVERGAVERHDEGTVRDALAADAGAHAARRPVVLAELVDDRAADPRSRVPLERFTAPRPSAVERLDEAAVTRRLEILAGDRAAGDAALDSSHRCFHHMPVLLEEARLHDDAKNCRARATRENGFNVGSWGPVGPHSWGPA